MTVSGLIKGFELGAAVGALYGGTRMVRKTFFEVAGNWQKFKLKYSTFNNDSQDSKSALFWGCVGGTIGALIQNSPRKTIWKEFGIGFGVGALYGGTKQLSKTFFDCIEAKSFNNFRTDVNQLLSKYSSKELDEALDWGGVGGAIGLIVPIFFMAVKKTIEVGSRFFQISR